MQVRDAQIIRLIERIGDHYRTNISNRFIRPVLLQLPVEKQDWDLIEVLMEKLDQYRYQGFDLDYLYKQIAATAHFVATCRRDLVPNLRNRIAPHAPAGAEKVLWDMAVNNFASNLQVFADLVNELYIGLVELDKLHAQGRRPLYLQIPDLQNIGRLLVAD
jgi:hypothetical protein